MKMIHSARLIIPSENGNFIVKEGLNIAFDNRIRAIASSIEGEFEEVIDAGGLYCSPGFINMHIHGIGGFDVMDATPEAMLGMRSVLPQTGVTSFLATTMTAPLESVYNALRLVEEETHGICENFPKNLARVLGAHLEGPYINPNYKGAQKKADIRVADFTEIAPFANIIKVITIAPEMLPVGSDFVERCRAVGIIVSIGHSAADYETALKAITKGCSHITHLFNAQTGLHHRRPGIVGAALEAEAVVELIADNVHVHPVVQRLVWRTKDHSKIVLVTDSMRSCGLDDGVYELGGQKVIVRGELATLEDGTIAASVTQMNSVVAKFMRNTGASVTETVELVTKNPAKELGLYTELGSLEVGKVADITLFDDNLNIHRTFVAATRIIKN